MKRAILILLIAAACGRSPTADAPRSTTAPCDPSIAALTITTGPLPAGCTGGVYTIDGEVRGHYPVRCAPAPEGTHVIGYESAGDCAGYGRCDAVFTVGRETIVDLATGRCD